MIYLDNAATTRPIGDLENNWFNSHSPYSNTDYIIQESKEIISNYLGCNSNEVYFTSSGSESNKICLDILYKKYGKVGISGMEHKSVLDSSKVVINDIVDYGMVNNETGILINGRYGYDLVQGIGKLSKDKIRELVRESEVGIKKIVIIPNFIIIIN